MSEQMNFQITAQNQASRAIRDVSRDLGGLKGAASRASLGLKASFAAASIAIAATTKFIVDSTKAAMEEEKVNKRLIGVLKSRKMATVENTRAIEAQVEAGKALAFSSDEIKSSLATIIPFAKDTTEAINIQKAAMEVAAAQNISLSKASTIVSRAFIGQGKSLAKLGIQTTRTKQVTTQVRVENQKWGASYKTVTKNVKEVVKGQAVLDMIMQKYGGTAEQSAQGVEKQFQIFHNTVSDLKQEFGRSFLPIALKIAQTLNKDILPQIKPVVTNVAQFITKNIPKFLADIDPIIQKIAGPNGLVAGFLSMAKAVWGANGEGPLGKAVKALGALVNDILGVVNTVIGFLGGAKSTPALNPNQTWGGNDERRVAGPVSAGITPNANNFSLKNIPLVGGALESAGLGVNKMGAQTAAVATIGGTVLSKLLFKRVPGLAMLASLGLGGYMAGSAGPGTSAMDTLGMFAGGAGTLQALSYFGGMMGGGGATTAAPRMAMGGGKPGILSRIGSTLLPSFMRPKGAAGVAAGAAAMGGVGAMTMSANTVYLNAGNVIGGAGGMGMPGMGGLPPLQGPAVPPGLTTPTPSLFSRISGKISASPVGRLGSMVGTAFGSTQTGMALKSAGSYASGQLAIGAAKFGGTGVGKALSAGSSLLGKGLGKLGGAASKGLGALGAGVPIMGGILAGANALAEGKGIGEAVGKGVGNAAGTAIGAGLMSWIPVAGPLLGGMLGGAIGEAIGGAIGSAVDGIPGAGAKSVPQMTPGESAGAQVAAALGRDYNHEVKPPIVNVTIGKDKVDDLVTRVVVQRFGTQPRSQY